MQTLPKEITVPENSIHHVWIELTNRCNLFCVHCYADSSPFAHDDVPLSFDEYSQVMGDAFRLGARSVQFIGGEPTINPLLDDLLHEAKAIGFERIEIFSNLTILRQDLLETVKVCGARFATSLYSDLAEIHDKITRKQGSHQKSVASIRRIVEFSVPIRVGVVVMETNTKRLFETKEFLYSLGVTEVGTDHVRQIGRPAGERQVQASELCGHCWKGNICIDSSGSVSPCIMSKQWKIGNLHEESLCNLASSSRIGGVRHRLSSEYRSLSDANQPCSPQDTCGPRACSPQVGGPPGCFPQTACAPQVFGD